MLEMYLKDGIYRDDDYVILTQVEDNGEQILYKSIFDYFKEYEMEDFTNEFEYGSDLLEAMDWNDDLMCFEYKNFRLYTIGFKIL